MYFATYENYSESNASPFFLISCWLQGIHENYYEIAEGIVIFPYTPYLSQQSSSAFEQKQVFPFSKVALIPLQPLAHVLQYLIIHIILPSQAIFRRTQQFKVWYDGVRSGLQVGCSNNFVMASMVYTLVCGMTLSSGSSTSNIFHAGQTGSR
jgi:hypothetical protein